MDFLKLFTPRKRNDFVSMLDLDVRRRELGLGHRPFSGEFLAHLFLSEEHDRILVVPTHFLASGWHMTSPSVRVVPFQSPVAEVGQLAREALLGMERRGPDETIPDGKPTDDPVFKASGLKTVQKFSLEYKHLLVQTSGGSIRVDEALGHSVDPLDFVRVYGTLAPACSHEALGSVILEVYHRSRYLKTCPKRRYR